MTIETAIQKAIEGGWNPFEDEFRYKFELDKNQPAPKPVSASVVDGEEDFEQWGEVVRFLFNEDEAGEEMSDMGIHLNAVLLDPTFWQCLENAMGWTKQTQEVQLDGFNLEAMNNGCSSTTKDIEYNWLYYWHRFIDHLADGGDANSFFEKL